MGLFDSLFMTREKKFAKTCYDAGIWYWRARDYMGALNNFDAAVNYNPTNGEAWIWLGDTFEKLGFYIEAKETFSKAESMFIDKDLFKTRRELMEKKIVEQYAQFEKISCPEKIWTYQDPREESAAMGRNYYYRVPDPNSIKFSESSRAAIAERELKKMRDQD